MCPTHNLSSRPPTDDERRVIEGQTKPDLASYGCLTLFFGIAPVIMLGILGGWLAGWLPNEPVVLGRLSGAAVGAAIFVCALASFIPYERRQRRRAIADAGAMAVEDIEVRHPRVVEIDLIDDNEPILGLDIGDGKLLFLQGQWLCDHAIYGAPPLVGDPYEEFLNGLPPPHSFPSSAFTVSRLACSGRVLRVRVTGDYLRPEKVVDALRPQYEFGESELLVGDLDNIAEVLAREHAVRFPHGKSVGT